MSVMSPGDLREQAALAVCVHGAAGRSCESAQRCWSRVSGGGARRPSGCSGVGASSPVLQVTGGHVSAINSQKRQRSPLL